MKPLLTWLMVKRSSRSILRRYLSSSIRIYSISSLGFVCFLSFSNFRSCSSCHFNSTFKHSSSNSIRLFSISFLSLTISYIIIITSSSESPSSRRPDLYLLLELLFPFEAVPSLLSWTDVEALGVLLEFPVLFIENLLISSPPVSYLSSNAVLSLFLSLIFSSCSSTSSKRSYNNCSRSP